jgi:AraC family transcriptional regulator, regulatory protein of adaptative response / DNA-3-methyladenine glycosylase II
MFDLTAESAAIAAALARDPLLAPLARPAAAHRICGSPDPFELAARAVLGQQISVAAARTIAARLLARFGSEPVGSGPASGLRAFPRAERIAAQPLDALRAIGLTRARAATLSELAAAARAGLFREAWERAPERLVHELRRLRGIGPWTANYIAMRAYGWADAFLAEDLLVQRALGVTSARAALSRAERFRPYRAYAVLALWKAAPAPGKSGRAARTELEPRARADGAVRISPRLP